MKTEIDKNIILIYDLWCKLCIIEISRFKYSIIQKNCLLIAESACDKLFSILKKHLIITNYDKKSYWTIQKCAGILLKLLSQCCSQLFLQNVIEYIASCLKSNDEHLKHSALYAFKCILNSSHHYYLVPIVKRTIIYCLSIVSFNKAEYHLKVIAAKIIKKICRLFSNDIAVDKQLYTNINKILIILLDTKDEQILSEICVAIASLADGLGTENSVKKTNFMTLTNVIFLRRIMNRSIFIN